MKTSKQQFMELREEEWSIEDYQDYFEAQERPRGYLAPCEELYADRAAKMSQMNEANSIDNQAEMYGD